MADDKKDTDNLLDRLKKQGDFKPQSPSVNPFTLDDVEGVDVPDDMPDLTKSSADEVKDYIERLEAKMRQATADFAAGRINQAQFQAIYTRHREQREIIERMQRRNPDSKAWQRVATEGYTEFLLKQHSARVLGISVFNNQTGGLIQRLGAFDVPLEMLLPMLDNLAQAHQGERPPALTQIDDGRWLGMVYGERTTSIVLYSSEPPKAVLGEVTFLHRDFERVNAAVLEQDEPNINAMVFPQKRLLEEK